MSKLSKLIKELCPEGVEYRPLGEIGSFERGRRFVKADAVESDGIPCVHYGELYTHYGLWANVHKSQIRSDIQTKLRYAEKNDVIIVGAGENNIDIGIAVAWLGDYKVAVHDACYIFKHQQDPKYISYLLRTNTYHQQIKKFVSEGKICSISAENLAKAVLPFPPVPIQQEIVRILDRYTELEEQLESELKAELEARRLQYENYRDQLLAFKQVGGATLMKLGDICSIKGRIGFRGYTRKDIVPSGAGAISLSPSNIVNGNMRYEGSTYISWAKYEESPEIMVNVGDIVFTKTASVGKTAIIDLLPEKATINPQLVLIKDIKCNNKFLSYVLKSSEFQTKVKQKAGTGSVPNISQKTLSDFLIPIPSIEEQQNIVSILDRLERLSNELQENLPYEISARRQQYEYYREKLLTFKRKAA